MEAIKVILDAMKIHIDNVGVCEKGCATLYSVTTDGKSSINKRIKPEIG